MEDTWNLLLPILTLLSVPFLSFPFLATILFFPYVRHISVCPWGLMKCKQQWTRLSDIFFRFKPDSSCKNVSYCWSTNCIIGSQLKIKKKKDSFQGEIKKLSKFYRSPIEILNSNLYVLYLVILGYKCIHKV